MFTAQIWFTANEQATVAEHEFPVFDQPLQYPHHLLRRLVDLVDDQDVPLLRCLHQRRVLPDDAAGFDGGPDGERRDGGVAVELDVLPGERELLQQPVDDAVLPDALGQERDGTARAWGRNVCILPDISVAFFAS